ncbi:hypothetical protein V5F40_22780 [Xanthobacter sp. DSM 14520]|uniref:hypothetical protein n=1 Tax=Xanthobacter autotrophicus (strain ATCC BAA-1158 / Py2) TaxID=78245 RepID=UPI0037269324
MSAKVISFKLAQLRREVRSGRKLERDAIIELVSYELDREQKRRAELAGCAVVAPAGETAN